LFDCKSGEERSVIYCRTTSASTAPCTSRRMCGLTHCASHGAPCQRLLRAFPGQSGEFWGFEPRNARGSPGPRRAELITHSMNLRVLGSQLPHKIVNLKSSNNKWLILWGIHFLEPFDQYIVCDKSAPPQLHDAGVGHLLPAPEWPKRMPWGHCPQLAHVGALDAVRGDSASIYA